MPQQVYTMPLDTVENMKTYYKNSLQSTPQGAVFRAKTPNAVITTYKSGKVLFQGKDPAAEAGKWADAASSTPKHRQKNNEGNAQFAPPEALFTSSHIGSDEAGTGDYFGPITVAAVYVRKDQIELLKELGVKDSKNLTDSTIKKIAGDLMKLELPYSLMILHNERYNQLQRKKWSQGKMKAMLHHHAIDNVLKDKKAETPDGILIDQFCEPGIYKRHIGTEQQQLHEKNVFHDKGGKLFHRRSSSLHHCQNQFSERT